MKTKLIAVAAFAALVITASARIGETPAQCNSRYGEPVKTSKSGDVILYRMSGMDIAIRFWNGTAALIMFNKTERDVLDKPIKMSATEQESLLEANSGGKKWIKGKSFMASMWNTEDSQRSANYKELDRALYIGTAAFYAHEEDVRSAEEKKNLKGF